MTAARELRLRQRIDQLTDERDAARTDAARVEALEHRVAKAEERLDQLEREPRVLHFRDSRTAICPQCGGPKSQKAVLCQSCRYPR